jgi:L-ascorbate metabolism protein UlaG (beta-lactamase superfamily)
MNLIRAIRTDDAFLNDLRESENFPDDFFLWWLGQSGFLLQWKGQRVLIDPYLSDSLTQKYAGTDKPHIPMCERVVDPGRLTGINVVTSSHNHTDHLDAETLRPVIAANPGIRMVIPEANREMVALRTGKEASFPDGLAEGISITIGDFTFHGIPAAHNEREFDANGQDRYLGYIISFGPWNIYHSGDTVLYPGMEEYIRPYRPDLSLLPINGHDPARGVAGNLDATEAINLARATGTRWLVPCHYDMFTFNTADVSAFAKIARQRSQRYCILDIGGKLCGREIE